MNFCTLHQPYLSCMSHAAHCRLPPGLHRAHHICSYHFTTITPTYLTTFIPPPSRPRRAASFVLPRRYTTSTPSIHLRVNYHFKYRLPGVFVGGDGEEEEVATPEGGRVRWTRQSFEFRPEHVRRHHRCVTVSGVSANARDRSASYSMRDPNRSCMGEALKHFKDSLGRSAVQSWVREATSNRAEAVWSANVSPNLSTNGYQEDDTNQ
ncbi:hypothetical protein L226DRAFT_355578 [Lentinus tigrinus ALCF2SS1-7]|uniref:uncharacterized protein n=1 Tax=Lentinus tigrinus ALCF2SS1-7 TaxID=1328758 RepID=UPI00116625D2|nr:hypothetical protein L226DRAFT_355578 [Lentinus tigrinus ALCF2SS1-7]